MKLTKNSKQDISPLWLLLISIALFITQFFVGNAGATLLAGLMDILAIVLLVVSIVSFIRTRKGGATSQSHLTHSQHAKSSRKFRKPEVVAQYHKLAERPLWRLFKVLYVLLGLFVWVRSGFAAWHSVCPVSEGHTLSFLPNVSCSQHDALNTTFGVMVWVIIGLIALYLITRRITAYVVYGKVRANPSS